MNIIHRNHQQSIMVLKAIKVKREILGKAENSKVENPLLDHKGLLETEVIEEKPVHLGIQVPLVLMVFQALSEKKD